MCWETEPKPYDGKPVEVGQMTTETAMFLEYDWTSDAYRSRLGDASTSIKHSFETLAAARHALRLIGLRLAAKTDPRTWRIEFIELGAERKRDRGAS